MALSDARAKYGPRSWLLLGDNSERSSGGRNQSVGLEVEANRNFKVAFEVGVEGRRL